jgi:DNA-binding NarL/FixJ family response regulator
MSNEALPSPRLYIVSRNPVASSLLSHVMESRLGPNWEVGTSASLQSHATAQYVHPPLFVLDEPSLGSDLFNSMRLLRTWHPGARFLVLLAPERSGPDELLRLMLAGVEGALTVGNRWWEHLIDGCDAVLKGSFWFPRDVIARYVKHTNLILDDQFARCRILTPREIQVLQLMLRRLSNKEIGSVLGISERTTRFHVSNIFAKLHVDGRTGLFSTVQFLDPSNLLRSTGLP